MTRVPSAGSGTETRAPSAGSDMETRAPSAGSGMETRVPSAGSYREEEELDWISGEICLEVLLQIWGWENRKGGGH